MCVDHKAQGSAVHTSIAVLATYFSCVNKTLCWRKHQCLVFKFAGSGSGYPWEKPGWLAPSTRAKVAYLPEGRQEHSEQDLDVVIRPSYSVSPICSLTPPDEP